MSHTHWTKSAMSIGIGALLVGCAQPGPPPLYAWGTFPRQQYDALLRVGVSPVEQIGPIEAQIEQARAKGAALPPGLRAHLGMLKLAAGHPDQARGLWLAEKTAFPESAPYMDQLLKRLDVPKPTAKMENPA